jgi:hypothetical protein
MKVLIKLNTGEGIIYDGVKKLEYIDLHLTLTLDTDFIVKLGAELRYKYNVSCIPFLDMYYDAKILRVKE